MGKITMTGEARAEVIADTMNISIRIKAKEKTTTRAISEVRAQTEHLLKLFADMGLEIEHIKVKDEDVSDSRDVYTHEEYVEAKKAIELEYGADIKLANAIIGVVQKCNYDINIRVNYSVKNLEKIHSELLKKAVLNSKEKAEAIAETLGEKILGIKEISDASRMGSGVFCNDLLIPAFLTESDTPLADKLSLPVQEEYEEIEVVWQTK